MRLGFTLLETTLALAIIGGVTSIAVPTIARVRDRAAVHGASSALVSAIADARHQALRWQRRSAVRFDTVTATVVVSAGGSTGVHTLSSAPLAVVFGVTLHATRDSIAFYPTGLGYGAANTRLIVARGAAAETVTVSRAGRVKR